MYTSLLIKVIQTPKIIESFSSTNWNLLLRQADSAKMLARLAYYIDAQGLTNAVPEKTLNHINSEHVKVAHLHTQVKQEVIELEQLFAKLDINAVYLKGTAYLLANLPLAQGRYFSDIDILLTQDEIAKVEIALKCQGWKSQKTDGHDQAYYRNYMHEIPPMQHILRGTVLDIHHNILPVCNANKIDIVLLRSGALPLSESDTHSYVLSPAAMMLHSAVHLFHEGELEQGLRGLSDLDILFHHFEKSETNFSQQLVDLSEKTNQQQSLFFTWRYLTKIFNKKLPKVAQTFIISYQHQITNLSTIDFIYTNLFTAHHGTTASWRFSLAVQLVYWRGHLLRMPLRLLIPHLLKKSWLRLTGLIKKDPEVFRKADALDPRFHHINKDE